MTINHLLNASRSRNLLSQVLLTQLGNYANLCKCEELIWLMSGFNATGANVVISSASNKRLRLMEWIAKMTWPCAWLVWPDQEISEQRAELNGFGFSFAQGLEQMSMDASLVPSRISYCDNLILRSIRIANFSDFDGLVSHYKLCHNIPMNYACQVASAHLGEENRNVCSTWIVLDRLEILSAITAYKFGSLGLISWLATCPNARRQGIGGALLLHAFNSLKGRGVDVIELQALPQATHLYQEIGFVKEYDIELWIHSGLT